MERCALCLKDRKLRKSHLMPKSLYRIVRGEEGIVSASRERGSIYTDKQVAEYLLCDDCEGMFSRKGESVVCGECCRREEGFILREKLKESGAFTGGGKGWLMPERESNINLDYKEYLYFGASILWRASAGRWPRYVGRMRGNLGSYEEKIRKYLLGELDFPRNVFLLVFASSDEEEDEEINFNSVITFPFYRKLRGQHWHFFYVPGIKFVFLISRMSGVLEKKLREANVPVVACDYLSPIGQSRMSSSEE